MEKITLTTTDNVTIIGNFNQIAQASTTALLLHMMPETKESWLPFQEKLAQQGMASLAIDLRGHGESIKQDGSTLDYTKFKDIDHQASIGDIRTAIDFVKKQGVTDNQLILVGASIGANLSLQYQSENAGILKTILLSPGLDYRGIMSDNAIKKLSTNQEVLLVASEDDVYSYESSKHLHELMPTQTTLMAHTNLGHGTHIFENNPTVIDEVIKWI